jgi:ELWxxDGT repeat protein
MASLSAEPLPEKLGDLYNSWWYTPIEENLYFNALTVDDEGMVDELGIWRSDGSEAGTLQISSNINSYQSYTAIHPEKIDSRIFFVADQNNNGSNELYSTDETTNENTLLETFDEVLFLQTIYTRKVYKNIFFFEGLTKTEGRELWYTDGSPGQAKILKDICPGDCYSEAGEMIEFNDFLFFAANDGTHESELWISNGTPGGTLLFLNIYPEGTVTLGDYVTGSGPHDFVVLGDKLIFTANDGIHGRELWVSDGTPMGTKLLKDCTPGDDAGDPFDSSPNHHLVYKDKLYYVVTNETGGELIWEIWVTDGTENGTEKLWTYDLSDSAFGGPLQLVAMNDKLFFPITHPDYGNELFFINLNETVKSATLLKDIFSGIDEFGYPNYSNPYLLTVVSGADIGKEDRLYFKATDSVYGTELWVSDGTTDGTTLLKVLSKDTDVDELDEFYAIGHKLFFRHDGTDLWVVDLSKDSGEIPEGVDEEEPKVTIKSPKSKLAVRKKFSVKGKITDNKTVQQVQCFYPGATEGQDAILSTATELEDGGQMVSFRCKVKLNKKTYKNLLRRRKKVKVRIQATDQAGNSAAKSRRLTLR